MNRFREAWLAIALLAFCTGLYMIYHPYAFIGFGVVVMGLLIFSRTRAKQ